MAQGEIATKYTVRILRIAVVKIFYPIMDPIQEPFESCGTPRRMSIIGYSYKHLPKPRRRRYRK